LVGAEPAVDGGGGVQVARLQATPQEFLIDLGTERRAHHMGGGGGGGEIRVAVDRVVHHQVAGQYFTVNPLAAGAGDRLGRFDGAGGFVELVAHAVDLAVHTKDIGFVLAVGIDDRTAADQDCAQENTFVSCEVRCRS